MNDFRPGNRVRINWILDDELHGRTGVIEQEKFDWVRGIDDLFVIALDKPLDDGTTHVDMWGRDLERLQSIGTDATHLYVNGLIKSWAAGGTAVVAAVHVRSQFVIDVACSRCGCKRTYSYDRGTTNDDLEILRDRAARAAYVHATTCTTATLDGS